jgi:hypothetical protein
MRLHPQRDLLRNSRCGLSRLARADGPRAGEVEEMALSESFFTFLHLR